MLCVAATTLIFIAKISVASAMEIIVSVPVQSNLHLIKKEVGKSRNSPLVTNRALKISASCTSTSRKSMSESCPYLERLEFTDVISGRTLQAAHYFNLDQGGIVPQGKLKKSCPLC